MEKPQAVPKTDDLSLSRSVHIGFTQDHEPNVNEKRTNRKPLGFGVTDGQDH